MNLASQLRHFLTGLAAIGTLLLSWSLIAPADVAALNEAGGRLVEPLVIFLSLLAGAIARVLIAFVLNIFRTGSGEDDTGTAGGLSLWLLGFMAVGIMGCLPSCSLAEYPISGSVTFRDPETGAKAGLTIHPRARVIRSAK